ncbi:hypothetical protein PR202_gb04937 [Eleusine coracana subsp. coracana]|uniref:Uncharacterized protein n=1 Tax=Eleusine coracana subsp. coracana TaxID=191504 RepID=A0AAV5E6M9_ELECO|nr:hypothetical protein PR202_gb04937 [Eleusine coracana subsp. coracana]
MDPTGAGSSEAPIELESDGAGAGTDTGAAGGCSGPAGGATPTGSSSTATKRSHGNSSAVWDHFEELCHVVNGVRKSYGAHCPTCNAELKAPSHQGKKSNMNHLTWVQRIRIALESAQGFCCFYDSEVDQLYS